MGIIYKKEKPEELEELEELEKLEEFPSDLSDFFAQNMKQDGLEIEVALSSRFVDSDEKPKIWKLRALSDAEREEIQKKSYVRKKKFKNGKEFYEDEFDPVRFSRKTRAASVVYPDLTDGKLQESYGVSLPEDLLGVMLTAGEGAELMQILNDLNGFSDPDELEETVKN